MADRRNEPTRTGRRQMAQGATPLTGGSSPNRPPHAAAPGASSHVAFRGGATQGPRPGRASGPVPSGARAAGAAAVAAMPTASRRRPSGTAASGRPGTPSKRRYLPGLDGLRALAVFAVIAYHLGLSWAQGGLVGVTVFFVISGFLITGLLLRELDESGTVDIKRFWVRRLRRLMPAVILVIAVTALLAFAFNHVLLYKLKEDAVPSLLWFTNWWYIFRQQSYFDAIAAPSPLLHFWSLAIEEQFYLVWPLVLLLLARLGTKRTRLRRIVVVLAAVSGIAMALLYNPQADPSRVYYGTDTRAFSLLVGAYLACVLPVFTRVPRGSGEHPVPLPDRTQAQVAGLVGLVALVVLTVAVPGTSPFFYRGGLVLASVLSAVLITAIVMPRTLFSKVFGAKPLVWLGKRSYGIYLWHYPLLLLMNPTNAAAPGPVKIVLELVLIVVASELSYRFVEEPLRRGAIGRAIAGWKQGALSGQQRRRYAVCTGACLALLVPAVLATALAQNPNEGRGLLTDEDIASMQAAGGSTSGKDGGTKDDSSKDGSKGENADSDKAATIKDSEKKKKVEVKGYEPLMIGDSVSIGLTDVFHEAYPGGLIDACGNRQIAMGQKVFDYYRDRDEVGQNVIIALGTNGSFDAEQAEALIKDIGKDRTIWFITNHVPASWQRDTNDIIAQMAEKHDNVKVIDWDSYVSGHEDWTSEDGIHLSHAGRVAFMKMIVDAIGENDQIQAATDKANKEAGGAWTAPEDGSLSPEMAEALQLGMTPAAEESRKVTGEPMP